MIAANQQQILSEIGNAEVSANDKRAKSKSEKHKTQEPVRQDCEKSAAQENKKSEELRQLKVSTFPIKAEINKYGFLGFGKNDLRALGLTVTDGKLKMAANVNVEIATYDAETRTFTGKIY